MATHCETCGFPLRWQKYRFCAKCGKKMLKAMHRAGYLQSTYIAPYFRDDRGRNGTRNPWPPGAPVC